MSQKENLISKDLDKYPLYFDRTSSPRTKIAIYIILGVTLVSLLITLIIATVRIVFTQNTGFKYIFLVFNIFIFSHLVIFIFLMHRYNLLPKDTVWYLFLLTLLTIVHSISSDIVIILD